MGGKEESGKGGEVGWVRIGFLENVRGEGRGNCWERIEWVFTLGLFSDCELVRSCIPLKDKTSSVRYFGIGVMEYLVLLRGLDFINFSFWLRLAWDYGALRGRGVGRYGVLARSVANCVIWTWIGEGLRKFVWSGG